MMLNHVNLAVADVPKSRDFFATYFGFKCVAERGRDALAVMVAESRFVLTISNFDKATDVNYPRAFHIGFMQDSREEVDEMFERLKADGLDPQPPREFHGAWTFYFTAPGGFAVEVGHQRESF